MIAGRRKSFSPVPDTGIINGVSQICDTPYQNRSINLNVVQAVREERIGG
jgi:hypothetical protein